MFNCFNFARYFTDRVETSLVLYYFHKYFIDKVDWGHV